MSIIKAFNFGGKMVVSTYHQITKYSNCYGSITKTFTRAIMLDEEKRKVRTFAIGERMSLVSSEKFHTRLTGYLIAEEKRLQKLNLKKNGKI